MTAVSMHGAQRGMPTALSFRTGSPTKAALQQPGQTPSALYRWRLWRAKRRHCNRPSPVFLCVSLQLCGLRWKVLSPRRLSTGFP